MPILTYPAKNVGLREGKVMEDMKPVTRALQTLAAIESETRELIHAEAPSTGSTETDAEIVPLVQKIGARSIAEIEKLIGEMQEAKNFLQTEWERIQRETARYTNLAKTTSASVEIIFDAVRGWREAGHPVDNQSKSSAFNITTGDRLAAVDDAGPRPQLG
jgi:hypothetical protein